MQYEKNVKDVIDTMNEEQKKVMYYLIGCAIEGKDEFEIVENEWISNLEMYYGQIL